MRSADTGAPSAKADSKRRDESVEITFGDFSHDRDAEDGSIELSLSCVDDESLVLEMRVQRFVGPSCGQEERREGRSVNVFGIAGEQGRDAELAKGRPDACGAPAIGGVPRHPTAGARKLV